MRCRVKLLVAALVWTLAVFILAKGAFMLFCHEGHPATLADGWQVAGHGLSLDFSTALYVVSLPYLLTLASLFWPGRWLLTALKYYFLLVALLLALAFVADTSLYPFWGFKLDASCLQYLSTPTEAMASVTTAYLLLRLAAFVASAVLIFSGYLLIIRSSRQAAFPAGSIVHRFLFLLLIPLIVIGIRGGLDESTTNIGQVYFSQNQFLNHAAVNPVFSFLSSFEKTASDIVDYDYYPTAECERLTDGLYPTTSTDTDSLLTTSRPDIVIILMESAGEVFAPAMPRLQQLKHESVTFSRCYANSWRTDRGTVCTYSGYPSFPTSSVMKMPNKTRQLPGIASALLAAGYTTHYIYGGDINFTNMRGYLITTGFSQLTWKDDYDLSEQQTAKWGVRDDITFQTLLQLITQPSDGRPRLIGYSTLSSHEPWDVPLKHLDEEIPNAFYYLDQCIADFMQKLKATPQWQNTLVILLPDHSYDYGGMDQTKPERNLIPMVWTGGAVRAPRQIDVICNQTDLAATLLAQLRLPHDAFRWSRDVLSSSYRYPFAMHTYNNGFSVTDSTGFMAYDLDAGRISASHSSDAGRLERLGKAILQATTEDLKEK